MIIFVTGIFDLLHAEHIRFLAAAKKQGQGLRAKGQGPGRCYLMVGIESDARVKKLKGDDRPIMSQSDRKEMLEALKMVDKVVILPEKFDTEEDYLKILTDTKADIYAVSENSPFLDNKKIVCAKAGVTLKVVREYNPEYSTTKIIEKIVNY